MKNRNRIIVGSALGLAALAVAIDHTRHRLPEPVPVAQEQAGMSDESPCGLDSGSSPCSMDYDGSDEYPDSSPCSMSDSDGYSDSSPCGLGD